MRQPIERTENGHIRDRRCSPHSCNPLYVFGKSSVPRRSGYLSKIRCRMSHPSQSYNKSVLAAEKVSRHGQVRTVAALACVVNSLLLAIRLNNTTISQLSAINTSMSQPVHRGLSKPKAIASMMPLVEFLAMRGGRLCNRWMSATAEGPNHSGRMLHGPDTKIPCNNCRVQQLLQLLLHRLTRAERGRGWPSRTPERRMRRTGGCTQPRQR